MFTPGNERGEVGESAPGRDGVDELAGDHLDLVDVLDVDDRDWCPATVTVSSTVPTRSSAFTVAVNPTVSSMPSRRTVEKLGQLKRHGVDARPQIDDAVLAGAVGDHAPDLLDQGRAAGFDRDARQHAAAGVGHEPARRCCRFAARRRRAAETQIRREESRWPGRTRYVS